MIVPAASSNPDSHNSLDFTIHTPKFSIIINWYTQWVEKKNIHHHHFKIFYLKKKKKLLLGHQQRLQNNDMKEPNNSDQ